MKLTRAISAIALFLVLLVAVYCIHISYFRVNVVFYSAISDGIIAAALTAAIVFSFGYFRILGSFEKLQLVIIFLLGGYVFAISIPTVIDRSLSFYILEKLQQRGGGIKLSSFEQIIKHEYVKEHRLVDVRLTEQIESGTIIIEGGCVKLTAKGAHIVKFSKYFRKNWLPKKRLIMGHYSDDLTDPFRNDESNHNYACD